jgi:hypothetical protein
LEAVRKRDAYIAQNQSTARRNFNDGKFLNPNGHTLEAMEQIFAHEKRLPLRPKRLPLRPEDGNWDMREHIRVAKEEAAALWAITTKGAKKAAATKALARTKRAGRTARCHAKRQKTAPSLLPPPPLLLFPPPLLLPPLLLPPPLLPPPHAMPTSPTRLEDGDPWEDDEDIVPPESRLDLSLADMPTTADNADFDDLPNVPYAVFLAEFEGQIIDDDLDAVFLAEFERQIIDDERSFFV